MQIEIYEKINNLLDEENYDLSNEVALKRLSNRQLEEENKRRSIDKINSVLTTQKDQFIDNKSNSNYDSADTIYVTKIQHNINRNTILKSICEAQIEKINALKEYFLNDCKEPQLTIKRVQEALVVEATQRRKMLMEDVNAKTIIEKMERKGIDSPKSDIQILTKDFDQIRELNIPELVKQIDHNLILSPRILEGYALDIVFVLQERLEKKSFQRR